MAGKDSAPPVNRKRAAWCGVQPGVGQTYQTLSMLGCQEPWADPHTGVEEVVKRYLEFACKTWNIMKQTTIWDTHPSISTEEPLCSSMRLLLAPSFCAALQPHLNSYVGSWLLFCRTASL